MTRRQPAHMGKQFGKLLAEQHISKTEFGGRFKNPDTKEPRTRQWAHELCVSKNWRTSTVFLIAHKLKMHPVDLFQQLTGLQADDGLGEHPET